MCLLLMLPMHRGELFLFLPPDIKNFLSCWNTDNSILLIFTYKAICLTVILSKEPL